MTGMRLMWGELSSLIASHHYSVEADKSKKWHIATSSVQFSCSVVSDSLQPHESQHTRPPCPSPSPGVHPNSMCIKSVMPSRHLILCCPLLLPPIPSSIRVFSNESPLCMRWPKYWSFSLRISPSDEHPGLVSCRMDWLDLLAAQGTLRSLLKHHSSKASVLWSSAFFMVQLISIHDYWKNHSFDGPFSAK